jgi:antitoxin component YwqK of YwqJK toxin-antitoxin module
LEGNEKAYFVLNTSTKEGIGKYYFTESNKLYKYGCYVNKKVHGKWTFYFTNGNKSSGMTFVNGEKIGKFIVYHENGKISIEGNFIIL